MQHTALRVARKYEHEAKERLRRINLVAAGLEVNNPKKLAEVETTWFPEGDPTSVEAD